MEKPIGRDREAVSWIKADGNTLTTSHHRMKDIVTMFVTKLLVKTDMGTLFLRSTALTTFR